MIPARQHKAALREAGLPQAGGAGAGATIDAPAAALTLAALAPSVATGAAVAVPAAELAVAAVAPALSRGVAIVVPAAAVAVAALPPGVAAGISLAVPAAELALAALALWWFGFSPWPLMATGLLCAAVYEVAFRAPLHWPVMGCLRIDPPPTAEMIWGALRGVAGVITVLAGAG